jgi:MFS family permease
MTVKREAALGFTFVTLLIDVVGFGIIIPVMPRLIEELTGKVVSDSSRYAGWLMAAYAITQFIMSRVIGGLRYRYGPRPVLLCSLPGFCLDYLLPENRRAFGWKRANPLGSLPHLRKYPVISGLIVALVLIYIAGRAVQSTWNFYPGTHA